MNLNAEIVQTLRSSLPGLEAVYLFGSVAKGEDRPGSDLDIAVSTTVKGSVNTALRQLLERQFGRAVDIIDLHRAPTILQKEVLTGGQLLWSADKVKTELYELYIWASYQKLCDERSGILEDGLRTGRFYQP